MATKVFVPMIIGIVAIAVIAGFFVVGSPQQERIHRFDLQRVNDLQTLQGQIVEYWQNKAALPPNLAALQDDIRGIRVPQDPATGEAYRYEARKPLVFALCANFQATSAENTDSYPMAAPAPAYPAKGNGPADNWEHGVGPTCFERTIDPDIYRLRLPKS